ncbi:hypothetical protein LIER_31500 [Lithospermum erythrorhizon]|uniref:Reverse transcriptase/retrotransposon-derived protein RNase H-like domain-containing protein n=1 Tax=Lithospermum erythrorhizon TaxID=34254 RepID=A0AAV3RUY5_LITER
MICEKGIEPNPDKIKALFEMKPPNSYKDIQKLTRCLAALSRFISKFGERNLPFFKGLRKALTNKFHWDDERNKAFEALKQYLGSPQLFFRPEEREELQLYLAIAEAAVVCCCERWMAYKGQYTMSAMYAMDRKKDIP